MFFEFYDFDWITDGKEQHLINFDEVLLINTKPEPYRRRNDQTGKVTDWYEINIYFTGKGNSWTFYYDSERERNTVYNNMKAALIENNALLKTKSLPSKELEKVINTEEDLKDYLRKLMTEPQDLGEPLDVTLSK